MNESTAFPTRVQRARGALLGLAVGDAIGTTLEFKPRGRFPPLTDMVGGGPFKLKAGQWTDDTSMALCLGHSLLDCGFDLDDQIQSYIKWHDKGYLSSTGRCFDIGNTTYEALERYRKMGDPKAGSTHPQSAGNGSIMRLAPVPIYYLDSPDLALAMSEEQSRTTHQASECLQACRLLAVVLLNALQGHDKVAVLQSMGEHTKGLTPALLDIALGKFITKTIAQIKGSGYVVQSLEASLWCFCHTNSFKDCVLTAANLGDDADTTAAIAGQIAGAFYGQEAIPTDWLERLCMGTEIGLLAEQLVEPKNDKTSEVDSPYEVMETCFGMHSLPKIARPDLTVALAIQELK